MDNADRTSRPNVQDIDITVGHRTHELMWQQRVKNKDLAAALDIDSSAIGKKLKAEQKFSLEQLAIVAAVLHTTIAFLVGEVDDPQIPGGDSEGGPRQARTDDPRIKGNSFEADIYGDDSPPPIADLDFERERRRPTPVEVSA
jgi:transcriptional regulator with XRE-family HTH domain